MASRKLYISAYATSGLLLVLTFVALFKPGPVRAQSCGGDTNIECCASKTCENPPSGAPCFGTCNDGIPSCEFTYNNCDDTLQCSINTSPPCDAAEACTQLGLNILRAGSCTYNPPNNPTPIPTAPPSCGDGICGSNENCSNCAIDCGACPTGSGDCTFDCEPNNPNKQCVPNSNCSTGWACRDNGCPNEPTPGPSVNWFNGHVYAENNPGLKFTDQEGIVLTCTGGGCWRAWLPEPNHEYFDAYAQPGNVTVSISNLPAGYSSCDVHIWDYDLGQPVQIIPNSCSISFNLPADDWKYGVGFELNPTTANSCGTLLSSNYPVYVGGSSTVTLPNPYPTSGSLTPARMEFGIPTLGNSGNSIASVTPTLDMGPPPQFTLNGLTVGQTQLQARGIMLDSSGNPVQCTTATATVNVLSPGPWWQVREGSVFAGVPQSTGGNISSAVPTTCTSPCSPYLISRDGSDRPGVAIAKGSISPTSRISVSPFNWQTSGGTSPFTGTLYDYDYFESKIPAGAIVNNIASGNAELNNLVNGTPYNTYWISRRVGSLTLMNPGSDNMGTSRVILFVDGNLTIGNNNPTSANIPVADGTGFFMAIVSGDIIFNSPMSSSGSAPDVEGIFFANGRILTAPGALQDDDIQLHVRGSLIGLGMDTNGNAGMTDGVVFNRSLTNNTNTPAELVEFAPDFIMNFPPFLTPRSVVWKEVAP